VLTGSKKPGTAAQALLDAKLGGPRGNDIVSYTVIEPPDDRYYPGYSYTQADGDVRTVGPRLKDLNIPFSLYGLPIPFTFGVRRLYGNMIWATPLKETVKKKKKGGKGNKKKSELYEYFATFAVGFGYPGFGSAGSRQILRMWADGSLIYDRRTFGKTKVEGLSFVFYPGTETQMPDPTIEAREGSGNVPPYRGMMYVVLKELPVGPYGDRPPAISIEVGDVTSPTTTVNNIQASLYNGSRSMTQIVVDWDRYQAYTVGNGVVRTFDLINNVESNVVVANPIGMGWDTNVSTITGTPLNVIGVGLTNEDMGYIPWLNKIICGPPGAGSTAVGLMDPASGIVTHWIGADGPVTNASYPNNEVSAADKMIDGTSAFYSGYIPAGRRYASQIFYNLYWTETFIFVQSTVYNDFVVLHLRGRDDILDMLYIANGTVYDEVVPGTVGVGYSDVYYVSGSTIYRSRLTALTFRTKVGSENTPGDFAITSWKVMPSGINNIWYYAPDDVLCVLLDNGDFYKYSCVDGSELLNTTITGTLPSAHYVNKNCSNIGYGAVAYDVGSNVRELDLIFGTVATLTGGSGWAASGNKFDSGSRSIVGIGTGGSGSNGTGQSQSMADAVTRCFYDRIQNGRIPLADFLEGVAIMAGYDPSEIEISSNIDDTIDGAMILNVTTFNSIMDPVSALYRFDIIESGGKIKFIRQALSAPATNFTIDEGETLMSSENAMGTPTFSLRREEEAEVPQKVSIRYLDAALSFNWSMQFSSRSRTITTNDSNNQITYEVPIVMTASEAKALSYKALWTAWNSRVAYNFRVSPEWLKIEPGDIGTVTAVGITYTVRAVQVTYNNDFTISVQAVGWLSDEAVDISADEGAGYPQTIPYTVGAAAYILDIPLLQETDDLNYAGQFPVYVVLGGLTPGSDWPGGSMWAAYDSLNFEEDVGSQTDSYVGVVPTVPTVPDSILARDDLNTMTVYTKEGDVTLLTTASELEVLNGANFAAYGANGRWEVIQFETVTDNGNGSYTLSGIYRGQRGTDYAVDNHRPGDTFVLLDSDWLNYISFPLSDVELGFRYKGVGVGQDQTLIPPQLVQLNGYGARPWPPVNIRATRSLSALTGDLTLFWERRSRTSGNLVDGGEIAPLEATEANDYLVSIRRWAHKDYEWSGSNWDEVTDTTNDVVTFEVTGATELVLTAAQIRTAELYEYAEPDNPATEGTSFTQVSGDTIPASATINEQIADLGFGEFVRMKYLEIMVQQRTTVPHSSGYGPGRWTTVQIEDT
jgi:hypothetical protein